MQLINPVEEINIEKIVPPSIVLEECPKLLVFESNELKELISTMIKNALIYKKCSEGKKAAIEYIKSL